MPNNKAHNWKICPKCDGIGKKTQKLSNKAKRWYEKELIRYEKAGKI